MRLEGSAVQYSISGGNDDGLFSIDPAEGHLTLAATLDYEIRQKHALEISAEAGAEVARVGVTLAVTDANDNPPSFPSPPPTVTAIEEDDRDLPAAMLRFESLMEIKQVYPSHQLSILIS
ncbi:putative neural-cadherin 2 [Penaeus japonicus]|uniref:putative neural-cadherin 2 n=1 Tax=Penaeus japonicus TaxID=27405 RepID=UPI001C71026E|nr:putative neural-cadherin 2 [Penaeus japonicus]